MTNLFDENAIEIMEDLDKGKNAYRVKLPSINETCFHANSLSDMPSTCLFAFDVCETGEYR